MTTKTYRGERVHSVLPFPSREDEPLSWNITGKSLFSHEVEVTMSREETVEDLKQLLQKLEAKKREIDSQYKAVSVTIQLLNGDSTDAGAPTMQQLVAEMEEAGQVGEDDDKLVPW